MVMKMAYGRRAIVILNENGEMRYEKEVGGVPLEWGGIYIDMVRITGPLSFFWNGEPITKWKHELMEEIWGFSIKTSIEGEEIIRRIVVSDSEPIVYYIIDVVAKKENWLKIEFDFHLAPTVYYMIKPRDYKFKRIGKTIFFNMLDINGFLHMSVAPEDVWLGGSVREEYSGVRSDIALMFRITPGSNRIVLTFTLGESEKKLIEELPEIVRKYEELLHKKEIKFMPDVEPSIETPDNEINVAYKKAIEVMRRLFYKSDEIFGVYSGIPTRMFFKGRDSFWFIWALLHLNQHELSKKLIKSLLEFQSGSDNPQMNVKKGEMPKTFSPFLIEYGDADTTLYFPIVFAKYIFKSNDVEFGKKLKGKVEAAINWGMRNFNPTNKLIEHGVKHYIPEKEEIVKFKLTTDIVDNTLLEYSDRRKSAIEVEALWIKAIEYSVKFFEFIGKKKKDLVRLYNEIKDVIKDRYYWPEENFFYDSIKPDGTPSTDIRPCVFGAALLGTIPPQLVAIAVKRALKKDLATDYGLRTLAKGCERYSPIRFTNGCVWNLLTLWGSMAAFYAGEPEIGLSLLKKVIRNMNLEEGYLPDAYRGDKREEINSATISAIVLSALIVAIFEYLIGIRHEPDGIHLYPSIPMDWKIVVKGVLWRGNMLDFDIEKTAAVITNKGKGNVVIVTKAGTYTLGPGETKKIKI